MKTNEKLTEISEQQIWYAALYTHYWSHQLSLHNSSIKILSSNQTKNTQPSINDYFQDKYTTNQKWNLCEALLHVGDWQTAQKLIEKLPKYSVLVRENVALALCDLVHRVIDPVYVSKCSVTPSRKDRIYTSNTNKLSTPQVNVNGHFYTMRMGGENIQSTQKKTNKKKPKKIANFRSRQNLCSICVSMRSRWLYNWDRRCTSIRCYCISSSDCVASF